MARLTKERWEYLRQRWEGDPREGFDWLASELNGDVSRQAISKMAKKEGWAKGGVKVSEKVAQPKKKSCATKSEVAQPSPSAPKFKPKVIPVITDAEWEEVDEKSERLHGNSKYDQRFDEMAYKLCLLGATDEELGDFFHVDESTVNRWKLSFHSFCESINRGKAEADAEVAASLFKRACGYQYTERKAKEVLTRETDEDGNEVDGEMKVVEVVSTVKEVPPDTGAAFIWLKNRRSRDWRDKQEIELNNKVGPDMLKRLETDMIERMTKARERQRLVLIERGLVPVENDDE
jgi:hypothetical protein